jgi:exonuclease VII small subunit
MESQTSENMLTLTESMERMEARIEAAAALFERAAALIEQQESERTGEVRKIVAAVETSREAELQKKLEAAEQQIVDLRAQVDAKAEETVKTTRRTVPAVTAQFLAKQGISTLESVEAGALDAALTGLSLEQRIAVKAQLLRAGVVS